MPAGKPAREGNTGRRGGWQYYDSAGADMHGAPWDNGHLGVEMEQAAEDAAAVIPGEA